MQSPYYFLSVVGSICVGYFLWTLGFRKLLLDAMREEIFRLRFQLFRLAMDGELSFDDEAYRSLETLLSGLLRFGHRLSLLTYLLSRRESMRAQKEKDYVNVSAQIALKVSRLNPETQTKIVKILEEVHSTAIGYIAASSFSLLSLYLLLKLGEAAGLIQLDNTKSNVRGVIEREVYLAESRRSMRLAVA
jgi:hypothetical protein